MNPTHPGATIPEVEHHFATVNGTNLHYVSAGTDGSPILLVHGFPESWWVFRHVIPMLAENHRVIAVDLRGFGDSANGPGTYSSAASAEDLHELIAVIGIGPVHLLAQDISGGTAFRLAATHPEDLLSLCAVETGLAGFGAEGLADITHGGAWYIGALVASGVPEVLLAGRERELLSQIIFPPMLANPSAVTAADLDELTRVYSRPDGFRGAVGLYQSMLREGDEIRALTETHPLTMPVLAVGAGGGSFTSATFSQVAVGEVRTAQLDGVGHYAALEAPDALATVVLDFVDTLDRG